MRSLFQNGRVIILLFSIINKGFSNTSNFHKISILNGQQKITLEEMQIINSAIKNISSNTVGDGLVGGEDEDRIYIYGIMYSFSACKYKCNVSENDKKIPVIAVQFWMTYGNGDFQYLLILDRKNKKTYGPLKIGGTAYREIAIYDIKNYSIMACARFYGPNDPTPQPSVGGSIEFMLEPSGIAEYRTVIGVSIEKGCVPRP
jgi:hypothetical protein